MVEAGWLRSWTSGLFFWCRSIQGLVNAELVVVALELLQLVFQVCAVPEEHPVQILAPDGADQALNKGCDTGVQGTLRTDSISRTRRLACQRWNSNNGSWSKLSRCGSP